MKKNLLIVASVILTSVAFGQNVAINSTGAAANASAALDVDMANKGILIPRVALTTTTAYAPVTGAATTSLLVYNTATAGTAPNNVLPGYYYWDGSKWVRLIGGQNDYWRVGTSAADVNQLSATGFIGTTSNNHMDYVTNGIVRGRFSNLGEFFVGTTSTALAGDLMNGVGNATFPWAVNGYTNQDGGGVYGSVTAGTTAFGAVQGEYLGTNVNGTGVRGLYSTATAGTAFSATPCGVLGNATTSGSYKFGVFGTGGTSTRSGGVFGYNYGLSSGALGYYTSAATNISVYGFGGAFTVGAAGGKPGTSKSNEVSILNEINSNIGLGIYGGMMGGWIRGLAYGMHAKGEIYSMYVDGRTYTNKPITQLIENETSRIPVYSSAAMKIEISSRGKSSLQNGQKFVEFSEEFKKVISNNPEELTITVSPMGNSNGIYIESFDLNGFTVVENNNGNSSVQFSWIAIGTRKNYEEMNHDEQLLSNDFDKKMNGVMFNDNNTIDTPQTMWWNGTKMVFDEPMPTKNSQPGYIPTFEGNRSKPASTTSGSTGSSN